MADWLTDNPWRQLRRFTPARIALGRAGGSLPTGEVLRFSLAHAEARDAVHRPLDVAVLAGELEAAGWTIQIVHSQANDRATYLLRPDLGRRLDGASAEQLTRQQATCDVLFVAADGLSSLSVQRHAAPLLAALQPLLPATWRIGPLVIAEQARVALGDEIGLLLGAALVVMLIGERPGLSSPDSLGAYLTWAPRPGRHDAERNCVSNIRPAGLDYPAAAARLAWLMAEAQRLHLSGIHLKERSDLLNP